MSSAPPDAPEAASEAPAPGSIPLTKIEHEVYARERVYGLPITHAAERAGLSKRSGAGSKIEALPEVQDRMAWLRRDEDEIIREKRRRLEERQWLIHQADIAKFYEAITEPVLEVERDDEGKIRKDEAGRPILRQALDADGKPRFRKYDRLKPFSEIPPELRLCIHSLTWTDSGRPNLKLYDKQDANREIRKLLGLDAPSKFAPTKADGTDLEGAKAVEALATAIKEMAASHGIDIDDDDQSGESD